VKGVVGLKIDWLA